MLEAWHAATIGVAVGTIAQLWRYPVKSMRGEPLPETWVGAGGVLGDRGYAMIDADTGKVVSAKNPRKWPGLLDYAATYEAPVGDGALPAVSIVLPGGEQVSSLAPDVDQVLSRALGRKLSLSRSAPTTPELEEYWPDLEELDHRDTVTDEAMPSGTFFDLATVHLLTTGTLARLAELHPDGRFDVVRFRPNIVVEAGSGAAFVENAWIGHTIALGDDVRLKVTGGCPRCVMTTLPQGDLPKDSGILRTAARYNDAHVGVYAEVVRGGTIRRGDAVTVVD
jgi:uncharacterized protein YcbX